MSEVALIVVSRSVVRCERLTQDEQMADVGWSSFIAELSRNPYVTAKLRADHAPDAAGYCRTCTTPGRGSAYVRFPCSLYQLADSAERRYALHTIPA